MKKRVELRGGEGVVKSKFRNFGICGIPFKTYIFGQGFFLFFSVNVFFLPFSVGQGELKPVP